MILAPTLSLNSTARGLDADATAFAAASGATDVAALSAFVKGVKELGLWNNMVCWPLRSSQNAGTGTTAYSLGGLGTFNGTLVNGPTWGVDGITVDASNKRVTTSFNFSSALTSILFVVSPSSGAQGVGHRFMSNDQSGTFNGIGVDDFSADSFRTLSNAFSSNRGTRIANTRTMFGLGNGTSNTFWFQNGSRNSLSDAVYSVSPRSLAVVGDTNAVGTALGNYSFGAAFDGAAMTALSLSSIYTLYKTTLGAGLGLP